VNRSRFERLVAEALDGLPPEFQEKMYQGIPLTKRSSRYGQVLPDRITIYQGPIEACCRTPFQVRHKVRQVVMHELGHHFGISDERLRELGVY
jgi:predicted Zn-dependent protease with MMP-like domain